MQPNQRELLRYVILFSLIGLGIFQIYTGHTSSGSGLLGGVIMVFIITTIKQKRIRKDQAQGINALDERTWTVAGKAAYAAYVTFALVLAAIVLLGSTWGPQVLVNPYNLLGHCLAGIVFLYVVFYYYYNYKM